MKLFISNRAGRLGYPVIMPWDELEARERARLWKKLLNLGLPKKYGPRSPLFVQGSPAKQVFLIEQGLAQLEFHTRHSRHAVLLLRFPGEWAGLCCACLQGPHFLSGTALTQSLIHEVDARRLLEVSAKLPNAAELLTATLATDVHRIMAALSALKLQSGRSRFEGLLGDFISVAGKKTSGRRAGVRLPVTDAEFAALISVTPEHLSRIKRELKAEGRLEVKDGVVYFDARRTSNPAHELCHP